jgi:hypothetical protein
MVAIRKAIESQYKGTCEISEYQKVTDFDNKRTKTKLVKLPGTHKCKLSFERNAATGDSIEGGTVSQTIKLFIAPEIIIKPGSKLTITQSNITDDYERSSKPAVYETHQEIMLELYKGRT